MNINKMRRHAARNTPDEISRKFDLMSDEFEKRYYPWVKKFRDRMIIKHDNNVRVDVYMNQDAARQTNETMIILRVVDYAVASRRYPLIEEKIKLRLDLDSLPHGFVERQIERRRFI